MVLRYDFFSFGFDTCMYDVSIHDTYNNNLWSWHVSLVCEYLWSLSWCMYVCMNHIRKMHIFDPCSSILMLVSVILLLTFIQVTMWIWTKVYRHECLQAGITQHRATNCFTTGMPQILFPGAKAPGHTVDVWSGACWEAWRAEAPWRKMDRAAIRSSHSVACHTLLLFLLVSLNFLLLSCTTGRWTSLLYLRHGRPGAVSFMQRRQERGSRRFR